MFGSPPRPSIPPAQVYEFHQAAQQQREVHRQMVENQDQSRILTHNTKVNNLSMGCTLPGSLPNLVSSATASPSPRTPTKSPPTTTNPSTHHTRSPGQPMTTTTSTSQPSTPLTPSPTRKPMRMYKNEEVLLFRVPGDASNIVLFGLPTKPFIHAFYDLRTVAKLRREADEAMRRARGETIPDMTAPQSTMNDSTTNVSGATAPSAAPSNVQPTVSTPASIATSVTTAHSPATINTSKSPSITTASAALIAAASSPIALAANYHAAHLTNIERVLHSIANKFGLVHQLTVQCKPRDTNAALQRKRRRSQFDEDEEEKSPIEEYEASFTLWAWVKYYSVLHAGVALKEFNRTSLGGGKRLTAKSCADRQYASVKPVDTPSSGPVGGAADSTPGTQDSDMHLRPYFPLSYHRCLDLCNYFLGFNNWNCSIKEIRRYDPMKDEELMDGQSENIAPVELALLLVAHN